MSFAQSRDHVDIVVSSWYEESPTFDQTVKQLAIRLPRVSHYLQRAQRRELASHGMEIWEFEVLITLRHAGTLTAGDLLRRMGVTSGAISNRLARLEKSGWIRRDVGTGDRRQVLVTLTEKGRVRTEEMLNVARHADGAMFRMLDRRKQQQLNVALRTILLAIEGSLDDETPTRRSDRFDIDNLTGGKLLADS